MSSKWTWKGWPVQTKFPVQLNCSDYKAGCQARHKSLINSFFFLSSRTTRCLASLDIENTKSPDRIGNELLRSLSESLNVSSHLIFNTIATNCKFSKLWQVTEVMSIFKEGHRQLISNYWPIILLSKKSEVIEKLIYNKLYTSLSTLLSHATWLPKTTVHNQLPHWVSTWAVHLFQFSRL